ncbi:hypothetical protein AAW00_13820 [Aurantiacibacter luteus]|uniref:Uncharacterized protein n=1 Tax=Aurantiacibacter luteus TaxID=1581420 RepID=A0A0G9MKN4_9SPHN|nr:hypothetical protein AAW00_13820 [Aurantiacibacter luteus]
MEQVTASNCYVVKLAELVALNFLAPDHPQPERIEWINRATDRKLSPSSLEQLLRTFHNNDPSPSVIELRNAAGVRAIFAGEAKRAAFATAFDKARRAYEAEQHAQVIALYETLEKAETAFDCMVEEGAPQEALSMLWRANAFMQADIAWPKGHSARTVLASVTGGGVAGAALGIGILVIPGLGPVAAAGAVLASAYSAVAAAGGIIGATGAAMAAMLSDLDVEDYAANHLEQQLKKGRIFLATDLRLAGLEREKIVKCLETTGGRIV